MNNDEYEAIHKRAIESMKWVELVGFEDEYFIQEYNGICVKKKIVLIILLMFIVVVINMLLHIGIKMVGKNGD